MELKLRTTRGLQVTEVHLTDEQRAQLAQLAVDSRYLVLLDVMERACIQLDTALINASNGDPEAVLGAHAVSRAGWLFFIYVQKQVLNAYHTRVDSEEEESNVPQPTLEETLQGFQ